MPHVWCHEGLRTSFGTVLVCVRVYHAVEYGAIAATGVKTAMEGWMRKGETASPFACLLPSERLPLDYASYRCDEANRYHRVLNCENG